jgi:homoserine kinase
LVVEVDDSAETKAMRQALPDPIPEAIWHKAKAMVVDLLQGIANANPAQLKICESDPIHQPYRLPLLQRSSEVYELMRQDPNLSGAFLSGSGPTIAAWLLNQTEVPQALANQLAALPFQTVASVMEINRSGFQFC